MCTVLLPPGVNPTAVNKCITSYHINYHIIFHIITMANTYTKVWYTKYTPNSVTNWVCCTPKSVRFTPIIFLWIDGHKHAISYAQLCPSAALWCAVRSSATPLVGHGMEREADVTPPHDHLHGRRREDAEVRPSLVKQVTNNRILQTDKMHRC
jgi:hypothetical protein